MKYFKHPDSSRLHKIEETNKRKIGQLTSKGYVEVVFKDGEMIVKNANFDEVAKLKEQIKKLKAENKKLKAQLK